MARTKKSDTSVDTVQAAAQRGVANDEPVAVVQQGRWLRLRQRTVKIVTGSSIPEILLISSLAMARYLKNSDFSYPSEIIINIVLLAVVVTIIFYLLKWVLRGRLIAIHTAGLLLAYACYNFSSSFPRLQHVAEWLIPNGATSFTKDIMTLLFLAVVFAAFGWVADKVIRSNQTLKGLPILKFAIFVVCFIFASQLVKVGARAWTIREDLTYKQPAVQLQQSAAGKATALKDKPNVYYLMFDRYANDSVLKNIYNYDNSDFANFLNEQGFVTRNDAYSNYPFTMMSASSTLAMGYHAEIGKQFKDNAAGFQTAFPYRNMIDNPPVVQALKQNGYQYNQVSSWWDFTRNIPTADSEPTKSFELRMLGKSFWMTDLQRDIINKSILAPLVRKGVTVGDTAFIKYRNDRNPVENFNSQMAALKKLAADSKTQTTPQFTFAHFLSPHDPYIFDELGEATKYDQNRTDVDKDERIKYTNQLTYVNGRIKELIKTILQKDPGAVIVMQSDEGPYPKEFRGKLTKDHYYDPINLPLSQMRQKFGIQASYYLPGVDATTANANMTSNVNAFRFVLDHYLGYDLPLLPDCNFTTGNKFYLYNYQLVTGKLNGGEEPENCRQYQ